MSEADFGRPSQEEGFNLLKLDLDSIQHRPGTAGCAPHNACSATRATTTVSLIKGGPALGRKIIERYKPKILDTAGVDIR
jgi:hypothetical protein